MPDDRNRFIIAVGARTDRSVRTSLERVRSEIDATQKSIKDQQAQQRILREEFRQYGAAGRDGASDVRREMLRGTEAIEEQRRELDRLTSEGRELNTTLRGTENNLGSVRDNLTKIGVGAVAIAGSVAAAVGVVGGAAQEGTRIRAVADRAGIDTDQVQRLTAELTYAGVETPSRQSRSSRRSPCAPPKLRAKRARASRALMPWGFDTSAIQEFQKLAPEEQFRTLAAELANVTNENERFFIAEQVLGGSLAEQVRGADRSRWGAAAAEPDPRGQCAHHLPRADRLPRRAQERPVRSAGRRWGASGQHRDLSLTDRGRTGRRTAGPNRTPHGLRRRAPDAHGIVSTGVLAAGAFFGIITLIGGVLPFVKVGLAAVRIGQLYQAASAGAATLASGGLTTGLGFQTIASGLAAGAARVLGAAMTFALGPIGLIIIGIGLAVAAGIFLYKNWDQVSYRLQQAFEFIRVGASGVVNFFIEGWNTVIGLGFKVVDAYLFVADKIVSIYNAIPGAPDIDIDAIRRIRDEAEAALTVTTRLDTSLRTVEPPPPKEQEEPALAQDTTAPAAPSGVFGIFPSGSRGRDPRRPGSAGSNRAGTGGSPVPAALAGSGAMQVAPAIRELQAAIAELRDAVRDQRAGKQEIRVDQQLTFVNSQVGQDYIDQKIDEAFAELGDKVRSQA